MLSQLWLAPSKGRPAATPALNDFVDGGEARGRLATSRRRCRSSSTAGRSAGHARPLRRVLQGSRGAAARAPGRRAPHVPGAARRRTRSGYLAEAAALREAEADEALGDQAAALEIYERLSKTKTIGARRCADAPRAERRKRSATRTRRPRRSRASSTSSRSAISRRTRAPSSRPCRSPRSRRAPTATSWSSDAPSGCSAPSATRRRARRSRPCARRRRATTASWCNLRLAECDYFLKRPRNARDGVKPYIEKASRQGEALFFYAVAIARARRPRRVPPHRSPPGQRVSDAELGGRGAEQPGDALHPPERRRAGRRDVPRAVREVSDRAATRSAPRGRSAGGRTRTADYADTVRVFESAAAQFPAVGLSSAVAVLVGAARTTR